MKTKSIVSIIILGLLLFCGISFADGVILPEVTRKLPDMPVQRGLIKYLDGVETLIIEATLDGSGQSFGWITPIPSIPRKFEEISPGLLKTFSFQLGPEIIHKEFSDLLLYLLFTGCVVISFILVIFYGLFECLLTLVISCGLLFIAIPNFISYGKAGDKAVGIRQVSRQIIGSYETFVLEAKESAHLNDWLDDNGFRSLPERALPVIDEYIEKRWCFVAAKLIREDGGISTPHPILMEFETQRPVYPMRLTALPGSTLHLELFVLAEKEAVSTDFTLRKEYCNLFDYDREWHRFGVEAVVGDTLDPAKYVGRVSLGRKERKDLIGHREAKKLMWDGCVVTKLVGKISSSEMTKDVYFDFVNAEPFRSSIYSHQGALVFGLTITNVAFMIGLLVLAFLYRLSFSHKLKSRANKAAVLAKLSSVLMVVCILVFAASYLAVGEKTKVGVFSPKFEGEWSNFRFFVSILLDDIENYDLTDAELVNLIRERKFYSKVNPFTKEEVIIEDSPGNITVERKFGKISGIRFYGLDGASELVPVKRRHSNPGSRYATKGEAFVPL